MKYKAVIFDQDGTVANTLGLIAEGICQTVYHYTGKRYPADYIFKHYLGPSEDGILQLMLPPEVADEAFRYYVEVYRKMHDTFAPRPFDGIKELFEHLHQSSVHVEMMTGKHALTTDISLTKFGIRDCFARVVSGSPKGAIKMDALRKMVQDLQLDMDQCIYVGDEDRDVYYCRELNMPVASAAWADTSNAPLLEELNPGMVFYHPSELEKWLLE